MSDHISGPRALAEPIADITDVYAFPSPQDPQHLVLVLNTLPFAQPGSVFSDGLIYRFRLRPLVRKPGPQPAPFEVGETEFVVDCVFDAPVEASDGGASDGGPPRQQGTCTTPDGASLTFAVGDVAGSTGPTVRVFAGVRWDPFFMDAPAALKTIATQQLCFTDPGAIYLDGKNVLSLVIELDLSLLPGVELVGVVAETLTRGSLNVRIERGGRPEVKNLMLAPKQFDQLNRDLEIRDLYNMEDAFSLGESYTNAYRARLDANLAFWDSLDGKVDWPADGDRHPLTEVVLQDFLVVDVTKPYQEQGGFFEIELAGLGGEPHLTCGGRALNDDVMDTIFTQLVTAGVGPAVRDGVDGATRPGTRQFPYLAEPNADPPTQPEHHH
jgi:hypothetical protein